MQINNPDYEALLKAALVSCSLSLTYERVFGVLVGGAECYAFFAASLIHWNQERKRSVSNRSSSFDSL